MQIVVVVVVLVDFFQVTRRTPLNVIVAPASLTLDATIRSMPAAVTLKQLVTLFQNVKAAPK